MLYFQHVFRVLALSCIGVTDFLECWSVGVLESCCVTMWRVGEYRVGLWFVLRKL